MNYDIRDIAKILEIDTPVSSSEIISVSVDSRQLTIAKKTLFIALPGTMNDGHQYIDDAYAKGVRNFIITKRRHQGQHKDANYLLVDDSLRALQSLATYHRKSFPNLKSIAITGSNGKTIVKEWLYQMLHDKFNIVKSPKSYNSQIGLALSLFNIEPQHQIGIFEAGISKTGEMQKHYQMLEPEIGLITNIGSAHDAGFLNYKEKTHEKMSLFKSSQVILYNRSEPEIHSEYRSNFEGTKTFTWGANYEADVSIIINKANRVERQLKLEFNGRTIEIRFRHIDAMSFENLMHCIAVMLYLEIPISEIQDRINRVSSLDMRLEMTSGINDSLLINDAYSADLDSLKIALEFTKQHAPNRDKIAILSSFDQSGLSEHDALIEIIKQLRLWNFTKLIYISEKENEDFDSNFDIEFFSLKNQFLKDISSLDITQKAVLIKGSRKYKFEDIVDRLADKGHSATLTINLNHLEDNLRVYKSFIKQETGLICVIKASAYGSGSAEIARLLQLNGVEYLAVAFTDEGVELRKAGISKPIMVLNPDINSLHDISKYNLEPEIYSLDQLKRISSYVTQANQEINIHLKLDTGMHRLGMNESDLSLAIKILNATDLINVSTIFSHLASSEDEKDDNYTESQFKLFDEMYSILNKGIKYSPKRHILNSNGISRFPERQYDLVRLGIGMYGLDSNEDIYKHLKKVHHLTANIIQIKEIKGGSSIGYNRNTTIEKDSKIAIVNIGYADGLMRNLGNHNFSLRVKGLLAPILGNVCMDLTIIDVSHIKEIAEGDIVTIFDDQNTVEALAQAAKTIPYEILSRISDRVRRKFIRE